jgi:hypothetical protein
MVFSEVCVIPLPYCNSISERVEAPAGSRAAGQLGEQDKARAWFAKAVPWLEKGNKDDAELQRFRAEAAELLGIAEKE